MCVNCESKKEFNDPNIDITLLQPTLEKYRNTAGSLITVLQKAQELYSYLPVDLLSHIAHEMKLKPADVYGVATFYTQFRLKPVGKNLILLCKGTACHVNGAGMIEEAIAVELGVCEGEITPDGLFTYSNVACLGCCSLSPVMMINGETYGALTPESARKIITDIRQTTLEKADVDFHHSKNDSAEVKR